MQLMRRLWFLIDAAGVSLTVRYASTHDNNAADALSRGLPFDELLLRPAAWAALERRFGPHTIDRYASESNALLPRFNSASPSEASAGALALSQHWENENNFAFNRPPSCRSSCSCSANTRRSRRPSWRRIGPPCRGSSCSRSSRLVSS